MKNPVNGLLGVVSFVLIVGGISGLLRTWFDWIQIFGFLRFVIPDGYEVFGYAALIVVGVAVGAVGGAVVRTRRQ